MPNESKFCKSSYRSDQGMVWGRFREHKGFGLVVVCDEKVTGSSDSSTKRVTTENHVFLFDKYPKAVDDSEKWLKIHFPDAFKAAKPEKKTKKKSKKK